MHLQISASRCPRRPAWPSRGSLWWGRCRRWCPTWPAKGRGRWRKPRPVGRSRRQRHTQGCRSRDAPMRPKHNRLLDWLDPAIRLQRYNVTCQICIQLVGISTIEYNPQCIHCVLYCVLDWGTYVLRFMSIFILLTTFTGCQHCSQIWKMKFLQRIGPNVWSLDLKNWIFVCLKYGITMPIHHWHTMQLLNKDGQLRFFLWY